MTPEAWLLCGYATFLLVAALVIEWLSAHTHRRSLRYRTAGFHYDEEHDHWRCPEGEHLWRHEVDHARRLARYRARAHVCNACHRKVDCTDSDDGREVVRALDPWPHSEAGRFHRGLSLVLVALAALVLVVGAVRHHDPAEAAMLVALFGIALVVWRWLLRDFRAHPSNFPAPPGSHGQHMTGTGATGGRLRTPWASRSRTGGSD